MLQWKGMFFLQIQKADGENFQEKVFEKEDPQKCFWGHQLAVTGCFAVGGISTNY